MYFYREYIYLCDLVSTMYNSIFEIISFDKLFLFDRQFSTTINFNDQLTKILHLSEKTWLNILLIKAFMNFSVCNSIVHSFLLLDENKISLFKERIDTDNASFLSTVLLKNITNSSFWRAKIFFITNFFHINIL